MGEAGADDFDWSTLDDPPPGDLLADAQAKAGVELGKLLGGIDGRLGRLEQKVDALSEQADRIKKLLEGNLKVLGSLLPLQGDGAAGGEGPVKPE